jgi:alpha-galactosidase
MKADKDNLNICYIGGGSRNWAWTLFGDLAREKDIGGVVRLFDVDPAAAEANRAIGQRLMDARNPGRWRFETAPDLARGLAGADFVFASILPGDFDKMAVDVHAPERYGVYQSVGDTVGPGGLMRALRTVPMYQAIARAVRDHAPDAWVFNYTNPMAVCVRALYREFPGIKAFGCCHEVFHTQTLLARTAEAAGLAPAKKLGRRDIKTRVAGINHFTWIDKASYRGADLVPIYRDFVAAHPDGVEDADHAWRRDPFKFAELVKFDLFKRFGLIAAAGDRHLAEFCPPAWYLDTPAAVKRWKFRLTTVDFRIAKREKLKELSRSYASGDALMKTAESGEEGLAIMKALLGLGDLATNVNLPNRGQMPDLPLGAVVETNALFARDRIDPMVTDGLPPAVRALVLPHAANQEGIVAAAFARDLAAAERTFGADPLLSRMAPADVRALFADMAARTLDPADGYSRKS